MSKLYSRENTAPKMKGAGDGLKTSRVRSSERIPVPSSRKFTATSTRDENIQLKVKKALDDIEAKHGKLRKMKSVAEITPTKSKLKKPKRNDDGSTAVLHATPRPIVDEVKRTPSGRDNNERRLQRWVYQRLLLLAWRRTETRLAMVSESLRRRQDQVLNLEKQVDCLKDLTQSECNKRNEAIGERQRMESILQNLRTENETLQADKIALQNELNNLRIIQQNLNIEMENLKNDVNSKSVYLKRLEIEIQKNRLIIKIMNEEKASMINEMKAQAVEMKSQEETIERLNNAMKNMENHLKTVETARQKQALDFEKLSEQHRLAVNKNECIISELNEKDFINEEIRKKINYLEEKLMDSMANYLIISNENELLRKQLTEKQFWWKNATDFMAISWAILQNAAYIMLPALQF